MLRLRHLHLPPLHLQGRDPVLDVRGEAQRSAGEGMSDSVVLRERLALGDRTFTVLAEPWYDATSDEWKGRYLYVPLDRSLASPVASTAVKRARKRDDLVRQLGAATDRELTKAFNSIPIPGARRTR